MLNFTLYEAAVAAILMICVDQTEMEDQKGQPEKNSLNTESFVALRMDYLFADRGYRRAEERRHD